MLLNLCLFQGGNGIIPEMNTKSNLLLLKETSNRSWIWMPCVCVFNKERDFFAGVPLQSTVSAAEAISDIFLLFFANDYSLSLVHRERDG
jgi:hypothetical protein